MPLHRHGEEVVRELVAAGAQVEIASSAQVQELLVLEGCVGWGDADLPRHSWLRVPADTAVHLRVREDCRLFTKTRPIYR